jgi:hypothetical protein
MKRLNKELIRHKKSRGIEYKLVKYEWNDIATELMKKKLPNELVLQIQKYVNQDTSYSFDKIENIRKQLAGILINMERSLTFGASPSEKFVKMNNVYHKLNDYLHILRPVVDSFYGIISNSSIHVPPSSAIDDANKLLNLK